MHLDASILRQRDRALGLEWLLTDGAGGYASSTVLLCGTRRYHGLWVPALKPPLDRRVVLAHIEEHLATGRGEVFLSTTEYGAGFFPDGSAWAETFSLEPLPRLVSRAHGVTVEREVLLRRDGAGVVLTYRVEAPGPWTLSLGPMLALRSFHALTHKHDAHQVESLTRCHGVRVLVEGMPAVLLWTDAPSAAVRRGRGRGTPGHASTPPQPQVELAVAPTWYFGVLRREERRRGFDHFEDLLMPCRWTFRSDGPAQWHVACSFDGPEAIDAPSERKAYLARQSDLLARAGNPKDERLCRLVRAADAFLVRRRAAGKDLASVIAGYHWFGDWGRDAMIALPGLALETGRLDVAEKVLAAYAASASEGMIPNCFDEHTGVPLYNTVDASLWFIQAAAAYLREGGRTAFVRKTLWPTACDVCQRYRAGTRFGIRADDDGLIAAGSPETQLTWMDATSAGRPVTPRYGKPVEIAALWISCLALMKEMARRLNTRPPRAVEVLEPAQEAFQRLFWNDVAGCLYDCILPGGRPDTSVRPNQILAVSLPYAPLRGERARAVVRTVRLRLLTPRGIRTLAPDDPAYRSRYHGGPDERDAAYHQGTVWPWLLGPYVDAVMAVEPRDCARGEAAQILRSLLDAMDEACLGQVAEVYDGDSPHRPGGAVAQAWSVAAAVHVWRLLEATGGVP